MTKPHKQFAKDVASELERRKRQRKLLYIAVWATAIVLAILYLRCGGGFGLGGGKGNGTGKGSGRGIAMLSDAGPARCTVRVTSEGITVDGEKKTRDEAVEACKKTEGAMVTVTGDTRQGDWDELRAALQAVGVPIYIRGQLWDGTAADAGAGSPP
jgi:hypothetical protein